MLLSEITFKSFLKFRIVRGKRKREKRAGGEDKKKVPKNKTEIQPEICPSLYGKDTHVVKDVGH